MVCLRIGYFDIYIYIPNSNRLWRLSVCSVWKLMKRGLPHWQTTAVDSSPSSLLLSNHERVVTWVCVMVNFWKMRFWCFAHVLRFTLLRFIFTTWGIYREYREYVLFFGGSISKSQVMAAVKTALDAVAKARVGCDTSMGKGNGTGSRIPIFYIYNYIYIRHIMACTNNGGIIKSHNIPMVKRMSWSYVS